MSDQLQQYALPLPALPDKRRAKDELNLAEFPLGILSEKEDPERHTVCFEDEIHDRRCTEPVARRVVVTSSPAYGGLPTPFDQDVLLGLVNLSKANNGFADPKVYFTRHQLIELLGLPDKGQTYDRIARSFHKWKGVSVHYEYGWWKRGESAWADEAFSFIDNFRLFDRKALARLRKKPNRQFEFPFSHFKWNEVVFQSFRDDYIRTLDLDFYLSLELPTTKTRMYRFLAKRLHKSRSLRFDLKTFAFDKIGLARSYENVAKIKDKLRPAFLELERAGFLKPLSDGERFTKLRQGLWEVSILAANRRTKTPGSGRISDDQERVRQMLIERRIHELTASDLVANGQLEKIEEQIEQYDWLHSSGRPPRKPAGYLVSAIKENYVAPDGFVSQKERRQIQRRQQQERRLESQEEARDAERRKQDRERAERFWASLGPEQRPQHEDRALANARRLLGGEPEGAPREELLRAYAMKQLEDPAAAALYTTCDTAGGR